jgi:2-amino-4-hydroxy-6-hydroxymethyldihydropteridine diphosphokinase
MVKAAIGLGSNIDNPIAHVQVAIARLAAIGELIAQSSLYGSKPWGVRDQPDFINACAIISVNCTARELLEQLLTLERDMGRERAGALRWGPRLIDLDILTFGDEQIDEPNLTVPHKHMLERAFVLAPLAEIDPSYELALAKLSIADRAEVVRMAAIC